MFDLLLVVLGFDVVVVKEALILLFPEGDYIAVFLLRLELVVNFFSLALGLFLFCVLSVTLILISGCPPPYSSIFLSSSSSSFLYSIISYFLSLSHL
jgi:hypothetical protein